MRTCIHTLTDAVGGTPLLRLRRLERDCPGVELYAKLEYTNPGGSVKDRAALQMIRAALESGELNKEKTLIDSTSGNTGVAYAWMGAALGIRVQLVMPSNVSQARKDIIHAFGTEIIFSDPLLGSDGAILHARRLIDETPEMYFYPDQYSNPNNPMAHYLGTGLEVLEQTEHRITHFVTGVGTSGTMMGSSKRLKGFSPAIQCIAVEPDEPMHGLEGLKHMPSSLVPAIYSATHIDRTLRVSTEDGWDMADRVAKDEGLHIGHSSGANLFGAHLVAKELSKSGHGGCVVSVLCDRGDRYFAPMKWEGQYVW